MSCLRPSKALPWSVLPVVARRSRVWHCHPPPSSFPPPLRLLPTPPLTTFDTPGAWMVGSDIPTACGFVCAPSTGLAARQASHVTIRAQGAEVSVRARGGVEQHADGADRRAAAGGSGRRRRALPARATMLHTPFTLRVCP